MRTLWWLLYLAAQALEEAGFSSFTFWALEPGSEIEAHGLSYPVAYGILLEQGSKLCLLHWPMDSLTLCYQGSPHIIFKYRLCYKDCSWSLLYVTLCLYYFLLF